MIKLSEIFEEIPSNLSTGDEIMGLKAKREERARGGSTLVEGPHLHKQHYLVTIKCNSLCSVTRNEIDVVYRHLVSKLPNAEWTDYVSYEVDSLNRMHIHTYCMVRGKEPYFKKYQKKNWTIDFQPFPPECQRTVLSYIRKHSQSEAAITNRFAENQYMFSYKF